MSQPSIDELAERLATAIRTAAAAGPILFVTGAGVSAASGIPTFRGSDPDAVWARDPVEMATRAFFESDPATSWSWYLDRFEVALAARPNPAHVALASLETRLGAPGRPGRFRVLTQNVDILHEAAGTRSLIKIHGTIDRLRCSRSGCEHGAPRGSLPRAEVDLEPFRASREAQDLPRCPGCGALIRPHVLWFDEYYQDHADYGFAAAMEEAAAATLVVFAGTSFSVGITDLLHRAVLLGSTPAFSIDPEPARDQYGIVNLTAEAEDLLPRVGALLGPIPSGPG